MEKKKPQRTPYFFRLDIEDKKRGCSKSSFYFVQMLDKRGNALSVFEDPKHYQLQSLQKALKHCQPVNNGLSIRLFQRVGCCLN
jgi:hypothetical protein